MPRFKVSSCKRYLCDHNINAGNIFEKKQGRVNKEIYGICSLSSPVLEYNIETREWDCKSCTLDTWGKSETQADRDWFIGTNPIKIARKLI